MVLRREVAVHCEAALHRAVSQLAARFSTLTGEHLGKKWYQHFEAWLFGRRAEALTALPAAMATSARSKPGAKAATASLWEQILPKGQLGVMTAADVELQRKLSAAGAPPALTDVVIAELARLPRMLAGKVCLPHAPLPTCLFTYLGIDGQFAHCDPSVLVCSNPSALRDLAGQPGWRPSATRKGVAVQGATGCRR